MCENSDGWEDDSRWIVTIVVLKIYVTKTTKRAVQWSTAFDLCIVMDWAQSIDIFLKRKAKY